MSGRARRATRPTPCLFGASLGLAPTAAFRARMWSNARVAALPFGSLGLASGNTRSRAGVPGASTTLWQGIARYDGKAAPTRATLHQAHSGKQAFSAAEVHDDPPQKIRSIAVDRATIVKRSRPSRVGAQPRADNFDHPLFNRADDSPLSARRPTAADGRHDECAESQPPRS